MDLRFEVSQVDDHIVAGVIGRWVSETIEADPSNIWATTDQDHWEKSAIFVNLDPHEQVVGIEYNRRVGKPSSMLKYLLIAANEASVTSGFKMDGFSITAESGFMAAVTSHPAPITTITFDLVVPNPTDAAGATSRALKRLKKRMNADRLKNTMSNKEGLNVSDPLIRDAADYAAHGGGDAIAKSDKDVVYDSRVNTSVVDIPEEIRPSGEEVGGLSEMLSGILKR